MTIIFGGIDFPVFEMLFIVSVLLLCGLFVMILGIFYILKELKALKGALREEKDDIKEFEEDISDLEKFEGKDKTVSELREYIKNSLGKGYSWIKIKNYLMTQGWDENQLEEAYRNTK